MAFHWQTFRTRALTAIIFAAVMLAGLFWNNWSFFILFSVIHFGCWFEYFKLLEKISNVYFNLNLKLGFALFGYGIMLYVPIASNFIFDNTISRYYYFLFGAIKLDINFILLAAGTLLTMAGVFQQKIITLRSFGAAALGVLYISLSWGLMIDLYNQVDIHLQDTMYVLAASIIPVLIIASIWINDTMAYIVGSIIGKTPLSKISPKKTWEGTIGGIILCVACTGFIISLIYFHAIEMPFIQFAAVVALIAAVTGTFGDLLESKLKRMAGVKDSGSIMPGHGGFLDRFDSLLLAIPFVWVYIKAIGF